MVYMICVQCRELGQEDRQTARETNGQTDRCTDIQTDGKTKKPT